MRRTAAFGGVAINQRSEDASRVHLDVHGCWTPEWKGKKAAGCVSLEDWGEIQDGDR